MHLGHFQLRRVLVCGSRQWDDYTGLASVLTELAPIEICHGGARGADRLAGDWADRTGVPKQVFPADWHVHGRRAGPIRNQQMLECFRPEVVVAFKADFDFSLRSAGTEHMVRIAQAAEVPTLIEPGSHLWTPKCNPEQRGLPL